MHRLKQITREAYFHLALAFLAVITFYALGWVRSHELNFVLFAIILGLFGLSLKRSEKELGLPILLVWFAFLAAVGLRSLPYIHNSVPLGYDPGLYKYMFEQPFTGELWVKGNSPLIFLLLTSGLTKIVGADLMLKGAFVMLSAATCLVLYYTVSRLYDRDTGVMASMLFTISIAQFETFWYNYYKNVFGIIFLLAAFMFFKYKDRVDWRLIVAGGLVAGFHQVAFFVFGLTYLVYVLLDVKEYRKMAFWNSVINGALIIAFALVINFDRIAEFLLPQATSAAEQLVTGGGSGTFFDSKAYFYYSLALIPFAITGIVKHWREELQVTLATAIIGLIVLFELTFHNRMIIYLDIFILIFAALGFVTLIRTRKNYGYFITGAFVLIGLILAFDHAQGSRPLISDRELAEIRSIDTFVEANSTVISTDGSYGPWIKGYVKSNVMAPGLFDNSNMTEQEWEEFWSGKMEKYLNRYPGPLYIHVGERQKDISFGECFENVLNGSTRLYKYTCTQ